MFPTGNQQRLLETMAEIKCPKCQNILKLTASADLASEVAAAEGGMGFFFGSGESKCPHCGNVISLEEVAAQKKVQREAQKRGGTVGCVLIIIIIVCLLAFCHGS